MAPNGLMAASFPGLLAAFAVVNVGRIFSLDFSSLHRKGATRHGSPLLEVRSPHDDCSSLGLVCANTLRHPTDFVWISSARLDGEAYSASPTLRDTFRRDAFPVGKPANPSRELLDSLEER